MLDMVALTDIEGNIFFANKAHEVLGYELESLVGKNVMYFVHPEDLSYVKSSYQNLFTSSNPSRIIYRYRCCEGSYLWLETRASFLRDKSGNPQNIVFSSRDITERKQAEESFRESEARFRLLAEEAPVSIMHFDKDGIVIFVNRWHIEVFAKGKLGRDFFMNKRITDLPGIQSAGVGSEIEKILKGETVFLDQVYISKFAAGHEGYQCIRGVPVFNNAGVAGGILIREDITERKQAENALRYKQSLFEGIVNGVKDILAIQHPDHTVDFYNQAGYELLGVSPEDIKGRRCYEIIGRSTQCVPCATSQAIERKKFVSIEKYVPELGLYLSCRSNPVIDDQGNVIRIVEHLRDITKQKRAEKEREKLQAQLNQAQKMESVGRLAGGVAHDFNNKLAIINGYAELTIEMLDPGEPAWKNLQEIYKAGKHSADIVRQLLAFARKQTARPVKLDLNNSIANILKMLQRLIGENIDLKWHPGDSLWPVKIDPSQVDQIMANLAVNSRDAISDVGSLIIETKNTIVDENYCMTNPEAIPGHYVMLAVSDDGCGIENEVKDQLFEPYFTTKDVGKGTGLGLPIVLGIVKQNKGFLNVYSEPGQGTTFKIYFPSDDLENSSLHSTKKSSEEIPMGSETILIVDDEPAILKMGMEMIERLGYKVLIAENPNNALRVHLEYDGKIDLLVTDVIMPEMNGRDLSSQMARNYPGLKTLYMSGYTADVITHHGTIFEGVQFIQKPFSFKDLAVKVREVLEQE